MKPAATYHGYKIYHDPPPIPTRTEDWQFVHEDYDGPGDPRCGSAASLDACKQEIDEIEFDRLEMAKLGK